MWQYNHSDTLYHHGIKGQRWGVRRYQNKDGTLTSAGKKRYDTVGDDNLKNKKREYKKDNKEALVARRNRSIKIGAAVAGTALVVYGSMKINSKNARKFSNIGQESLRQQMDLLNFMQESNRMASLSISDGMNPFLFG